MRSAWQGAWRWQSRSEALAVKQPSTISAPATSQHLRAASLRLRRPALTVAQELDKRRLLVPHVEQMVVLLQKLLADLVSRRPQQPRRLRVWGVCCRALCLRAMARQPPEVVRKAIRIRPCMMCPRTRGWLRFVAHPW